MILINEQVILFIITIITGMFSGFIYDLFRILRKNIKHKEIFIHIEDLIYWIIIALVVFYIIFNENHGEIRGFILFGAVIGAILYFNLFSKWVMKISVYVVDFIKKIITMFIKIINIVIKIIKIPYGWLKKVIVYIKNMKCLKNDKNKPNLE